MTLKVTDSSGNTVTPNFARGLTKQAVSGYVTFDAVALGLLAGNYKLEIDSVTRNGQAVTMTSPGASNSFGVTAAAPSQLRVATNAAGAKSGQAFSTQPVVEILDQDGSVTTSTATITLSASGVTLVGTPTATAVNGTATFAGTGITGVIGTKTLTFTTEISGNTLSVNQSVVLANGSATALRVSTQPVSKKTGATFGSAGTGPIVELVDAQGNRVLDSGSVAVSAQLKLASDDSDVSGQVETLNASSGLVDFSAADFVALPASYKIAFSASNLTSATSTNFAMTANDASVLAWQKAPPASPTTIATGDNFDAVIKLEDAFGNPVVSDNTTSIAVTVSGAGTLTGATATAVNLSLIHI